MRRTSCPPILLAMVAVAGICYLLAPTTALARSLDAIKARGVLTVCANPNALPFSSRKGERRGIEVELAEALAKELGVGLEVGWVVFPYQAGRVDCDVIFDSIVDSEVASDAHLRLSKPYNVSGVAIGLRPGIEGVKGFADLKKDQRVGAIVGSLASVRLGQKGLPTIPFTFEDEMVEALGKGEIDVAAVSPATIGFYNLTHPDAKLQASMAFASVPQLNWSVAVGMRKADDALVDSINAALGKLLTDGTVHRIYAGYGIEQQAPPP